MRGVRQADAIAKMNHIFDAVKDACPHNVVAIRSAFAVTIVSQYPYRHVQIVTRLYNSPAGTAVVEGQRVGRLCCARVGVGFSCRIVCAACTCVRGCVCVGACYVGVRIVRVASVAAFSRVCRLDIVPAAPSAYSLRACMMQTEILMGFDVDSCAVGCVALAHCIASRFGPRCAP